jgi:hypothetical protein
VEVTTIVDEVGLAASAGVVSARLGCSAFTRTVYFSDGIMFLRGRVLRWLPDTALTDATPEAATTFVRTRITLIEVV